MISLCDEIKKKMHTQLGQSSLDDKKYITYWQWLLSHDLHTLYYKEHETWFKKKPSNRARKHTELKIETRSKNQ